MKFIAAVGKFATNARVAMDLEYPITHRPNQIIIVQDTSDCCKLVGMRGIVVGWLDYGANEVMRAVCAAQNFEQISITAAKDFLARKDAPIREVKWFRQLPCDVEMMADFNSFARSIGCTLVQDCIAADVEQAAMLNEWWDKHKW